VIALRPVGAEVRELIYKRFDDIAPAASIEELAGFSAVQSGLNSWQVRRDVDGHIMPGEYPTQAAARSAIAT
jgi:hypothetical protein